MEITEAIRTRRSIRRYKPEPVPKKLLEEIVETSQWAESPQNTQPWEFAIVGGDLVEELKARMTEKFVANETEEPELPQMTLPEPYSQRAADYRNGSDSYQFPPGTEDVEEKRRVYMLTNMQFRTAPNVIVVYAEKSIGLNHNTLIGIGAMAQTVCLTALAHGLGTCIMGAPRYHSLLKEKLGIPDSKVILHVIGIGYPDMEARVNNFPRTRIPLDSWVHWHGF